MRKDTDKDQEDLVKEIESDPEIDKKCGPLTKGHVVEIRCAGTEDEDTQELSEETKSEMEEDCAKIKGGKVHTFEEVNRELGL